MLMLGRADRQGLTIRDTRSGDIIRIQVQHKSGRRIFVALGIEAPPHYQVTRDEAHCKERRPR